MTQKVREIHSLNVPRDAVCEVIKDLDPEGLESTSNFSNVSFFTGNLRVIYW